MLLFFVDSNKREVLKLYCKIVRLHWYDHFKSKNRSLSILKRYFYKIHQRIMKKIAKHRHNELQIGKNNPVCSPFFVFIPLFDHIS